MNTRMEVTESRLQKIELTTSESSTENKEQDQFARLNNVEILVYIRVKTL